MRDNRLSNRVVQTCDDIVALRCEAWNKIIEGVYPQLECHTPRM